MDLPVLFARFGAARILIGWAVALALGFAAGVPVGLLFPWVPEAGTTMVMATAVTLWFWRAAAARAAGWTWPSAIWWGARIFVGYVVGFVVYACVMHLVWRRL
jgi:hypothetical protein